MDASIVVVRDVIIPNNTPTGLSWNFKTDGDKETFSDLYLASNFADYTYKFLDSVTGTQRQNNEVLTANTAANALTLNASGFSGNLNSAITTFQLLANAVDTLPVGGTTLPVVDTVSLVKDPVDTTKQVRLDAGNVATATTRVIFMPNSDVNLGLVLTALQSVDSVIVTYSGAAPSSYTPTTASVQGHLEGIDDALQVIDTQLDNAKLIIDGMVVDKAVGNVNNALIEVDDKFFGWISDTRFVAGKATAIPWNTAGNSIFAVDNEIA
jgi:hypothetical protein